MDDTTVLEDLPVEQLIEMIRERTGAGVNLSFPGKVLARQLGRRVRPRNQRTVKKLSAGDEHGRSRNLLIEGDNLQGSLTRFSGHLICSVAAAGEESEPCPLHIQRSSVGARST
ncbi:hypothetical protein R4172_19120 [Rhodococcus kroppenstedtii]|uniref:hypothetical protein n=1 Tax=Rhodococcoides kroppenstedtii TaxID=293050 RepID=UPI002952ED55|nr:hypothetical protein [Rhodococcus kroppenstedtii]MDV7199658.1 hypothetical protein [Rhodococcus kroppenstedtii]